MDPVVRSFVVGAVVPGLATCAILLMSGAVLGSRVGVGGMTRRGATGTSGGIGAAGAAGSAATPPALAVLASVLIAVGGIFGQWALTGGLRLNRTSAFDTVWMLLGLCAVIAALGAFVGVLGKSRGGRGWARASVIATLLAAAVMSMLAANVAKLDWLAAGVLAAMSLVAVMALGLSWSQAGKGSNAKHTADGLWPAVFVTLWLLTAGQCLQLGLASQRLALVVHCMAGAAGGVVIAAAVWPSLRAGWGGALVVVMGAAICLAQGVSLGGGEMTMGTKLAMTGLLVVSAIVFAAGPQLVRWVKADWAAGVLRLILAGIPATAALALAARQFVQTQGEV